MIILGDNIHLELSTYHFTFEKKIYIIYICIQLFSGQ